MPDLDIKIRIKNITFRINILTIPIYIIAIISSFTAQFFITVGFIAVHELGHIVAAFIKGARIYCFRILPVGVSASIEDYSCKKLNKIFIYSAGPSVNIIFAVVFFILYACQVIPIEFTVGVYINIWLAFFNLLPVMPLDGGKIAMEVLSDYSGLFKASKHMNIITVILSVIIIFLGLIIFKNTLYNLSLVIIGIYILLCNTESRKETALMNIKNLLFRRSRILKQRIYPIREIAVMKDVKLSEVVKAMDYANMFHIINVLDENMRIIKVISEQEILDAIIINNINTEIGKIL
ncbi:site-2 protease family protein [Ruminiclostridium herbifermentans]|uniref:Site-2 protease family protein n=1 Tax=Ruminiclostridium herbifermentans TaxID=2488810 RepID=A0A4U7JAW2_9FIRM|nr:site-2 protease family protein [Ruminiclostridium herbifermentans]QNU68044.1 site-2 protease family protein [Ruminiclostridium herbifermentans]